MVSLVNRVISHESQREIMCAKLTAETKKKDVDIS